jgi:hypothetical protein
MKTTEDLVDFAAHGVTPEQLYWCIDAEGVWDDYSRQRLSAEASAKVVAISDTKLPRKASTT